MCGCRAPYVPGWDCHGQPIEYKVKKELGKEAGKLSQAELRKLCRAYAEKYVGIQRQQFKRLGVFGDWEHPYLTMSPSYEAEVIARWPIWWGMASSTAARNRSIGVRRADGPGRGGVEYADHVSPSVYVKFAVTGRNKEFAVIWTTTPWTLPANLAIAAKPDLTYVRARTSTGETWILAKGRGAGRAGVRCGVDACNRSCRQRTRRAGHSSSIHGP